jgi:hypothetical protein
MTTHDGPDQHFTKYQLTLLFVFSLFLVLLLLFVAGYGFGYDLFWQQLGAGIVLYLTTLAGLISILRKPLPLNNFLQFFLLFLFVAFPLVANFKMDHSNLTIDSFETGIGSWSSFGARGVNSTIMEQSRQSPFGSWHMTWSVSNSCAGAPEGSWAVVEYCGCPLETFSLRSFSRIDFWYKTETNDGGFCLELRSPNDTDSFSTVFGPSTKWKHVSLILPKDSNLENFTQHGHPLFDECHIAFGNSCNNTYSFDQIELTSRTFLEQNLQPFILGETGLGILTTVSFVPHSIWLRIRQRVFPTSKNTDTVSKTQALISGTFWDTLQNESRKL